STLFDVSKRHEMKSLWNCGSITCITCFTWLVSQRSISSSRANSLSGPLHVCRTPTRGQPHVETGPSIRGNKGERFLGSIHKVSKIMVHCSMNL
uniref:Uncharacterized protein n=1 Tax=Gouania willdenowi TaxID=441366 RepID=A0A8C5GL90_GOUWI